MGAGRAPLPPVSAALQTPEDLRGCWAALSHSVLSPFAEGVKEELKSHLIVCAPASPAAPPSP